MAGKFLTRVRSKALLPFFFTKSTLTGLLLLLTLCVGERSAQAALRLELIPPYPGISSVRVTGNINDMPMYPGFNTGANGVYFMSQYVGAGEPNTSFDTIQINAYFNSVSKRYAFSRYRDNVSCPTSADQWRNTANSTLGSLTLPLRGVYDESGFNMVALTYTCTMIRNGTQYSMDVMARTPGADIEVINPPAPNSVCSLNGQNMFLDFNSTSLNVNGLSQTQNLSVSCTSGTAKDYNLRLTGSNVTDGRLNFGNGVSAQIYLNGTAVRANDASGIRLNALTSRTVSVRGDLVGTASGAGTTNASGVLILDAL